MTSRYGNRRTKKHDPDTRLGGSSRALIWMNGRSTTAPQHRAPRSRRISRTASERRKKIDTGRLEISVRCRVTKGPRWAVSHTALVNAERLLPRLRSNKLPDRSRPLFGHSSKPLRMPCGEQSDGPWTFRHRPSTGPLRTLHLRGRPLPKALFRHQRERDHFAFPVQASAAAENFSAACLVGVRDGRHRQYRHVT